MSGTRGAWGGLRKRWGRVARASNQARAVQIDEYKFSRRNSAPFSPDSEQRSYSARTDNLYSGGNTRRMTRSPLATGLATTSDSKEPHGTESYRPAPDSQPSASSSSSAPGSSRPEPLSPIMDTEGTLVPGGTRASGGHRTSGRRRRSKSQRPGLRGRCRVDPATAPHGESWLPSSTRWPIGSGSSSAGSGHSRSRRRTSSAPR
jgi:hypothetical protein